MMETWIATSMLAQAIAEERRNEWKREPIVLFNFNFNWLKPVVKNLIGLFL
jgi:hypothetical protein